MSVSGSVCLKKDVTQYCKFQLGFISMSAEVEVYFSSNLFNNPTQKTNHPPHHPNNLESTKKSRWIKRNKTEFGLNCFSPITIPLNCPKL